MCRLAAVLVLAGSVFALPGCDVDVNLGGDDGGDSGASAAASPTPGPYAGTTSQGLPIAFSVSSAGRVENVQFAWRARCEDGQVYVNTIVLGGGPVEDGAFQTGGMLETGGIGHVSGTFDGSQASGELSRSRGTAFGVDCRVTGIDWSAEPGPPPEMPVPSMGSAPGQPL
jgi:hypothetical protein